MQAVRASPTGLPGAARRRRHHVATHALRRWLNAPRSFSEVKASRILVRSEAPSRACAPESAVTMGCSTLLSTTAVHSVDAGSAARSLYGALSTRPAAAPGRSPRPDHDQKIDGSSPCAMRRSRALVPGRRRGAGSPGSCAGKSTNCCSMQPRRRASARQRVSSRARALAVRAATTAVRARPGNAAPDWDTARTTPGRSLPGEATSV